MSQCIEIYQHKVVVDCNQSVRLYYKGNAFKAELYSSGCKLDECSLSERISEPNEDFLDFFNGAPLHCGLVKNNEFKVKFHSYTEDVPTITYVVCEPSLTWDNLEAEEVDGQKYFVQNVELTTPSSARKNNMLLYVGSTDDGFCGLRYVC
ncbi:Hypothetical protein PACV_429 [Pacmanvirus A23]|uniref:Hypothetical protein n=1 Tax=Pacmanvirus A23 TaxID=1932881 RepID=UPI000A094C7E|nr:Hypothetical protein B9W72_gp425 [Pacmanvirus A23]SIP86142.1 Hypothetical protein PACV_429 [Pacmanvirus A23]